ncbi:MAG: hypothetical protein DWI48_04470 [Chloroflexi bacterium]|nr:MAG: hypothetical protein DWI48_04470 [Chloroflexota bacterium]
MRAPGYEPRSVGFEKIRPPSARSKVSVRGVPACVAGAGAGAAPPLDGCGAGAPGAAVAVGLAPSVVEAGEALPDGEAPGVALAPVLAVPLLVVPGVGVPLVSPLRPQASTSANSAEIASIEEVRRTGAPIHANC